MRRRLVTLAMAAALGALAGCAEAERSPRAETGSEASPAQGVPAEGAPAEAATDDGAAWSAPESCRRLPLEPGGTLPGAGLGECVSQALRSYGSGKERVRSPELQGEISFTYDPDFAFQGGGRTGGGEVEMTYVDGTMWVDRGDGPVKGDIESADPEERMVGVAAQLYRIFADPSMTADLIAASRTWRVDAELARRTQPDGERVEAHRIVSAAPFRWHDIPVEEFVVWFAPDWTPVGTQASIRLGGMVSTSAQDFYDLGEPVTIVPLG